MGMSKGKGGVRFTLEQARAHAQRHGYALAGFPPDSGASPDHQNDSTGILARPNPLNSPQKRRMNKTETEYSRIAESQKQKGEILEWRFEALTLVWGDGMRYKPDFACRRADAPLLLVEIKGGHIWSRDLVRFKGCRAEWKSVFDFELWQKKAGLWNRLL